MIFVQEVQLTFSLEVELSFDSVQEVQDQEVWASHQLARGQGRGETL